MNKGFFIPLLMVAGCRALTSVEIRDVATDKPVEGALVQRWRPATIAEHVFNPVGTFYHPKQVAEARWTDTNGVCKLNSINQATTFTVYHTNNQALIAEIGTDKLVLSPSTNLSWSTWAHTIYREGGQWRVLHEKPWWDWQGSRNEK